MRNWPAFASRFAASVVLVACRSARSPTPPAEMPCCHLAYVLIFPDESSTASVDYAVNLGGRIVHGRTDAGGHLMVEGVAAGDYQLEIGGVRMYVSASSSSEPARRLVLINDVPTPSPGR